MEMNKIIIMFLLILLSTGCSNKYLSSLRQLDDENRKGLVAAYDEALLRQYIERQNLESQLIDTQSTYTLVINAYIKITGIRPDDPKLKRCFSAEEIIAHNKIFDTVEEKRHKDIEESYLKFKEIVDRKKHPEILESIRDLEGERKDTETGFWNGIKTLWGLLPTK